MPWANPPCPKASSWAVWANCKREAAFQTTPNSHKPSANKNSIDAISRLFCYVETSEYLSDSRIRPTFSDDPGLRSSEKIEARIRGASLPTQQLDTHGNTVMCLNPRFVGQVFRQIERLKKRVAYCLNPRLVGQVFRLHLYTHKNKNHES